MLDEIREILRLNFKKIKRAEAPFQGTVREKQGKEKNPPGCGPEAG